MIKSPCYSTSAIT